LKFNKLQDRNYLHKRHHLSHRQIDFFLGKGSGSSFIKEKLLLLLLVSEFLSVVRLFNSRALFFIPLKGPLLSQRIYSDSTVRLSHDIDILIKREDFDIVYELMISNGYKLCNGDVWPKSKAGRNIMLNSAYHLAFCKQGSKFMIEIHWKLFKKPPVSSEKISRIIEESVIEISFNGEVVKCFSPEFDLVYNMIHGSKHGWSRLKWLVDIKDYPLDGLDSKRFNELISEMRAQKVLTQTNFLLNSYFHTKLPFTGTLRVNSFLLNYPLECIKSNSCSNSSIKGILKKFIYNFLLFPGIMYRVKLFTSLITSSRDAGELDSQYTIVYYLYRPWSFIKRRLLKGVFSLSLLTSLSFF